MKKLIPMTDFVLEQNESELTTRHCFIICLNYAKFLKQPLELWMFVPCDKDGNVLKFDYPQNKAFDDVAQIEFEKQYQQAKERCLFEGFEIIEDKYYSTKREVIYLPNTKIQVWSKLTYRTGEIDTFFFDYYNEFKTVEGLVKYDLQLTQIFNPYIEQAKKLEKD